MQTKEFQSLVHARASHRKYLSDPISDEDMRLLVDAARMAPSGHNLQPWRFIAVRSRAIIDKMADVIDRKLGEIFPLLPEDWRKKMEGYRFYVEHFREAPLSIAVLTRSFRYEPTDSLLLDMGMPIQKAEHFDMELLGIGAAIQNILLAAQAMGLGSCWLVEPVTYAQRDIESILEVAEPYRFVSLITIGKPTKTRQPATRKAVEEILTVL